jgi:hypothetical protein
MYCGCQVVFTDLPDKPICGRPGQMVKGMCVHEHMIPRDGTSIEVCDEHYTEWQFICLKCQEHGHECLITLIPVGQSSRIDSPGPQPGPYPLPARPEAGR